MELLKDGDRLILRHVKDFDLDHTFLCGQCFRFEKREENRYIGVASSHLLDIAKVGDDFVMQHTTLEEFQNFWSYYFAFDIDYDKIKKELSKDDVLRCAIHHGQGIRILRQDLFETILSFILSQSNNITRIRGIIQTFCQKFGEKIVYEGREYYTFPHPRDLMGIELEDLADLKAGYRDKYVYRTILAINEGKFSLDDLYHMPTPKAKEALLGLSGVGEKVANCILLFGLSRFDSFPIDVWIRRVMEHFYYEDQKTNPTVIAELAQNSFGDLGGFAQQYLFFYAREQLQKQKSE